MKKLTRRSFIQTGAIAGSVITAAGISPRAAYTADGDASVRFRELGATGWKVSEIGFGTMNTRDEVLIQAAIDRGVNYIDTAHVYMNGQNEQIVGNVMKTMRDKVFLTTKLLRNGPVSQFPAMMETSLKRLKTDYVDCVLLHDTSDRSTVTNQEIIDTFAAIREKGQARFIGLSMHSNSVEVLNAVIESGFWQIALVGYNFTSPPELTETIARARASGIGIVAMKNLQTSAWPASPLDDFPTDERGTMTSQQAMIKWVLEDSNVDVAIPGMTTFEHLDMDMDVMRMKLSYNTRRSPRRYADRSDYTYCSGVAGCTGCKEQCPNGVAVNEVNRCLGYAEGYGDITLAKENYHRLPRSNQLEQCHDCDECQVKCRNGLNLTERIKRASTIFLS